MDQNRPLARAVSGRNSPRGGWTPGCVDHRVEERNPDFAGMVVDPAAESTSPCRSHVTEIDGSDISADRRSRLRDDRAELEVAAVEREPEAVQARECSIRCLGQRDRFTGGVDVDDAGSLGAPARRGDHEPCDEEGEHRGEECDD